MHKKRTGILALVVLLVLAVAAAALYTILKPAPSAGSKTITVHVDHLEGGDTDFTISTDAEYLRQALEQEDLIVGSESQYGLWVETVDGETHRRKRPGVVGLHRQRPALGVWRGHPAGAGRRCLCVHPSMWAGKRRLRLRELLELALLCALMFSL